MVHSHLLFTIDNEAIVYGHAIDPASSGTVQASG